MTPPLILSLLVACAPGHIHGARILNVVDGDTVDALVDLDLGIATQVRIRLYGVDAAEMNEPMGPQAKAHVSNWVGGAAGKVYICTHGVDSFGRVLADIAIGESQLARELLEHGYAVPRKK